VQAFTASVDSPAEWLWVPVFSSNLKKPQIVQTKDSTLIIRNMASLKALAFVQSRSATEFEIVCPRCKAS
jgi:hypothetical protein